MHRCTETQFVNFLHAPNVFCLLQASLINGFVNQPESYSVELLMGLELYYEKGCFWRTYCLLSGGQSECAVYLVPFSVVSQRSAL